MSKKNSHRRLAGLGAVLALAAVTGVVWIVTRGETSGEPTHSAGVAPIGDQNSRRLPGAAPAAAGSEAPAAAAELPPAHSAHAVQSALEGYQAWLERNFPTAEATFLGADCSFEPCLIGLSFGTGGFADTAAVREFFSKTQGEIERRVSFKMTTVHADEDTQGRQYLWMYSVPQELSGEQRDELSRFAEYRHAGKMDPLRAPIEPDIPGPGEPGYAGE